MDVVRPSSGEIAKRGEAIYDAKIRALVEAGHVGEYVVIDIDSGEFEIDADHLAASDRAAAKHPNGVLYAMRVGHRAGGRIGARSRVVGQ